MHSPRRFCSHLLVGLISASICLILAGPSRAQIVEHKLTASDGAAEDWFGLSVSLSGGFALVGAPFDDDLGTDSGSAYVYEQQRDGSWLEVAKLTASDGTQEDWFGNSVSLSGERALVGAVGDDDVSGSAYVYEQQGDGSWLEVDKLTASDGNSGEWFGISVSLWGGTRALVGAYGDDDLGNQSGSAYVFERQGDGSWLEVDKLTASDGVDGDRFGNSVSIWKECALVGAYWDDDNGFDSGAAYFYERQGDGSWLEIDKLTASDGAQDAYFGYSVSLWEGRVLVGAIWDDDLGVRAGSAYLFEQSHGSWLEVAKLTASDGTQDDWFGFSVALSGGGRVLIGSSVISSGSAYVFEQSHGSWLEVAKLTASDGVENHRFGWSVSLSGDRALVGAYGNDDLGTDSGSAYVYENIFPTAIETISDLPQGYLLSTPYPNPFNPRTVVPFEVSEAAHIRLTLVDIFGREVAILLNGQVAAGRHEAVLDGGRLASGVYLVRLEAEGVVHATQKVLLLR